MTQGAKKLTALQLGIESTAGAAVAATSIWRGVGNIEDARTFVYPNEDVGYLSGVNRLYQPDELAIINFEETPATWEQIDYILDSGISEVAGVQDGSGTDYIRAHSFPTTTQPIVDGNNPITTRTIEWSDNIQNEESAYCFVTEFNLKGVARESWMIDAVWNGRQITKSAKTGSISLVTVEEMLFSKTKLYIDAVGGTLGNTQITGTLLEASLSVKTGWRPVWTADGQLYFTIADHFGDPNMEVMLDLKYKHNSSAVAQKDAWVAGTKQQIRLTVEGSAIGTPGTTYSVQTMNIDIAGTYEKFNAIEEEDGGNIISCTFRARYDPTAALFAVIRTVNELSALP